MTENTEFKYGFEAGKDFKKRSVRAAGYAAGAAYSVAPSKRTVKKTILIVIALAIAAVIGIVGTEVKAAYDRGAEEFQKSLSTQNSCRKRNADFMRLAGKWYNEITSPVDMDIKEKCWAVYSLQLGSPKFSETLSHPYKMSDYFAAMQAEKHRNYRIDKRLAADPPYTYEKFRNAWDAE
ncbi:hypothetical protein [Labrenzia sp. PHM005]|uniref:hypothetical protein n=1 Tax=Labrenzia sp. PHM005 TaxID=2590016 RepID=UPI0011403179|nr:hypothetical protein [Labrenzia sp. PHM005]QDG77691.1 hypothetical protein FJ695_18495 [Labrenzia sp. PHM005]